MTKENPQEWKPVETDEIREIRLRGILEDMTPVMLAFLTKKFQELAVVMPPGEDITEDLATIDFLQSLEARDLEVKILKEWKAGDDFLVVSFLALTVSLTHLHLQDVGRKLQERKEAGIFSEDETKDFFDLVFEKQSEVEGILSQLLEKSELFGRKYELPDLISWIKERDRQTRDTLILTRKAQQGSRGMSNNISQRQIDRYRVFDRILGGGPQKTDRDLLRKIIDDDITSFLFPVESNFIKALGQDPGARENLTEDIKSLLKLYQIRPFVDQAIPDRGK